jgi:5-methylcytosine-specific restriction endonuclease McrA
VRWGGREVARARDWLDITGRASTCHLCGERIDRWLKYPHLRSLSIDHIVPRSKGGTNARSNLAAAHLECNRARSDAELAVAV